MKKIRICSMSGQPVMYDVINDITCNERPLTDSEFLKHYKAIQELIKRKKEFKPPYSIEV